MDGNISPKVLYFKLHGWLDGPAPLHPILVSVTESAASLCFSCHVNNGRQNPRHGLVEGEVTFWTDTCFLHSASRLLQDLCLIHNLMLDECLRISLWFFFYYLDWREELVHQRAGECSREEWVSVCGVSCGWQHTGFTLLYQHTPTVRDSLSKAFAF